MNKTLFILNHPPYGTAHSFNALRLAGALLRRPEQDVKVFLMADAVLCAKSKQKVSSGYYNLELMLKTVLRHQGAVALCGTCMDARGMNDTEMLSGAKRSTLVELTDWTLWADKVITY